MLRWIATNLRTFFWAFILAVAVWVSAVTDADPDEVRLYPNPIALEIIGQDPTLILTSDLPEQVEVTLRAPRSVWDRLTAEEDSVRAILDLSGLGSGQHTVPIQMQVAIRPARIVSITPAEVTLTLEPLTTRTLPISIVLIGEPAIGYQAGEPLTTPDKVVVSGPESLVQRVDRARISVNLTGARESVDESLPVELLDRDGLLLRDLTVNPDHIHVALPISQQGGYRDMAVKVVVTGQVASGYRLSGISVFPPVVTVFSEDPERVNDLPGVVETQPLDLNNAESDITTRLSLTLPEGISVVGEQSVLVQVSISPIQGSITLKGQGIEVVGLSPGLSVQVSPTAVDVILSGPLPKLDTLTPQDVRVYVDVSDLEAGTHQLTPQVEILIGDIRVESILPATVEVTIAPNGETPTPTPTATP
ncbi:MAG: hypothetical protein D6770_00070 [Anaerolineae bacterium]|nr:MAG: hypothetical protein D6770_00070 [Anaerolineae bacterium]